MFIYRPSAHVASLNFAMCLLVVVIWQIYGTAIYRHTHLHRWWITNV